MKIQDGTGKGYLAKINNRNRLEVTAKSESAAFVNSITEGTSYIWSSAYSATSADKVIYLKNTDSKNYLVIDRIRINSVNAGVFTLYEVSGTPSGTVITGKNTNLTSGNTASATSYGDNAVTGLTLGDRITLARTQAAGSTLLTLDNILILGFQDAISLVYVGSNGLAEVTINGYYESIKDI